jgi:hypothetical protein
MNHAKYLMMTMLAAIVLLAASTGWSQDTAGPPDVDGATWMKSNSEEKRAFLYGAGSAFVLEYFIRTKHDEEPSRFVKGWVEVFKSQTWGDLEQALDRYYTKNPDRMNEHVFHVIWRYIIQPNLKS